LENKITILTLSWKKSKQNPSVSLKVHSSTKRQNKSLSFSFKKIQKLEPSKPLLKTSKNPHISQEWIGKTFSIKISSHRTFQKTLERIKIMKTPWNWMESHLDNSCMVKVFWTRNGMSSCGMKILTWNDFPLLYQMKIYKISIWLIWQEYY
jgi:hypothetical protein